MNDNVANFDKKVKVIMVKGEKGDSGSSGDYAELDNKPSLNGITINGAMTTDDLGLASQQELDQSIEAIEENSVYLNLGDPNDFEYNESLIDAKVDLKVNEKIAEVTYTKEELYTKEQLYNTSLGVPIKLFDDKLELFIYKGIQLSDVMSEGEIKVATIPLPIFDEIMPDSNPDDTLTTFVNWRPNYAGQNITVALQGYSKVNGQWATVLISVINNTATSVLPILADIIVIKERR